MHVSFFSHFAEVESFGKYSKMQESTVETDLVRKSLFHLIISADCSFMILAGTLLILSSHCVIFSALAYWQPYGELWPSTVLNISMGPIRLASVNGNAD